MPKKATIEDTGMRLDKWLWCARFYRTRGQAAEAIRSGKVLVNGTRIKPSKIIDIGNQLHIRQKLLEYEVTVKAVPKTRLPAKAAGTIYEECRESLEKRDLLVTRYKLDSLSKPRTQGKPEKHDRRKLIRLRGKNRVL